MSLLRLTRIGIHLGCLVLVSLAFSTATFLFTTCIDTELSFKKIVFG